MSRTKVENVIESHTSDMQDAAILPTMISSVQNTRSMSMPDGISPIGDNWGASELAPAHLAVATERATEAGCQSRLLCRTFQCGITAE